MPDKLLYRIAAPSLSFFWLICSTFVETLCDWYDRKPDLIPDEADDSRASFDRGFDFYSGFGFDLDLDLIGM